MNKSILEACCAIFGALVGFLFGVIDGLFYALIAFVILDYITGVIVAVFEKKLSSEIGFKGIVKKVILLILVAVANIIDVHVIGGGSTLKTVVISVLLANEGISILENAGNMGVPIPKKLMDILKQIKQKNESEDTQ